MRMSLKNPLTKIKSIFMIIWKNITILRIFTFFWYFVRKHLEMQIEMEE